MAGKVDAATHAAAIARISEAVKHEAELRAHLDDIIKGAAFKGSHRSQAFLKHIVEHALHGEPADLRERSIGVALFGRPVTYDTADDAIVRVTASDVRKRLLQHYGTAGAESNFRINLPAGSYVPEFCMLPASVLAPIEAPVIEPPIIGPVELREAPPPKFNRRTPLIVLTLVLLTAVAAIAAKHWVFSGTNDSFFVTAFQGTPRSVQVIVADDALVLIQVLLDRRFSLEEYENLTYMNAPEVIQKKELQRFWSSLSTRQITNVGDLQNANRIAGELEARGLDVTIRQARQMHARAFRSGNFVVLGSSLSNPWAALFRVNESNFPFDELPRPGMPEVILNRRPLNGEPARFEVHKDPATGKKITFARVHLLENTAHSGRVLLVAGQSMSATELAGEFLLRNDS
ncbi:MAG TPA: hypothetical protein VNV86_18510, partial [Candidatus Acidoferrum sp.]|nr:hypothetical protein [Candidatus Acidoferrum sp.]